MQAGRRRRLVGDDVASRVPVLRLDPRARIPGGHGAHRAGAGDGVVDQRARPVRTAELGLVERRAGRPRAGVEGHRRRRAGLELDVADDGLEGRAQRAGVAAHERVGVAAAEHGHLVQRRDRARVGDRVAHADDIGLDVVGLGSHRGRAQRGELREDVELGLSPGPAVGAGVVGVDPLARVVLRAVGAPGRVAVGRHDDEVALAGLRDRRLAGAVVEVLLDRVERARERCVEGRVLDLAAGGVGLVAEQCDQVVEVRRAVGQHLLDDLAVAGDVVAVAPAASDPDLARHGRRLRQPAGVGREERDGAATEGAGDGEVGQGPGRAGRPRRTADVVRHPRVTDAVHHRRRAAGVENVVDVGVVARLVVRDEREAVDRDVGIGDAAQPGVAGRTAGDAVVGVDHRRRVADVVGVRVVERVAGGLERRQAPVERVAIGLKQRADDVAGDVAARRWIVAADHLAGHGRVHRLGVVEDDHQVRLDGRREEERVAGEGERWCRGGAERRREDDRDDGAAQEAGGECHGSSVNALHRSTAGRRPSRAGRRRRAP